MKAYKGFNKHEDGTLWCQDMQYKPGITYKCDDDSDLRDNGFKVYPELCLTWRECPNNGANVFYDVECGGEIIDTKNIHGYIFCSEITILNEIDMSNIPKFDRCMIDNDERPGRITDKLGLINHIDRNGRLISNTWWVFAFSFGEQYACVQREEGHYNHIDTKGRPLSEIWWDRATPFVDGYAMVRRDDKKYNCIDTKGNIVYKKWRDNDKFPQMKQFERLFLH